MKPSSVAMAAIVIGTSDRAKGNQKDGKSIVVGAFKRKGTWQGNLMRNRLIYEGGSASAPIARKATLRRSSASNRLTQAAIAGNAPSRYGSTVRASPIQKTQWPATASINAKM